MAAVNRGRWTARIEGDPVILLTGARFQAFHLVPPASDTTARTRLRRAVI